MYVYVCIYIYIYIYIYIRGPCLRWGGVDGWYLGERSGATARVQSIDRRAVSLDPSSDTQGFSSSGCNQVA